MMSVFRQSSITTIFVFAASGLLNAGGAPIFKECPLCMENVQVYPPDENMPFILLHGQMRHMHGICYNCVPGFSKHSRLEGHMNCPVCRTAIDADVRTHVARWEQAEWHKHNEEQANRIPVQEWNDIQRMQREDEEAATTEEAVRSRRDLNSVGVLREAGVRRRLEEKIAAERRAQGYDDARYRSEDQEWFHRNSEEWRTGERAQQQAEWERWSWRPRERKYRHIPKIGVGITCMAVICFILWRALRTGKDCRKRQRSFLERVRAYIRALA